MHRNSLNPNMADSEQYMMVK